MRTLGDITAKRARLGADREALIFEDVRLTYGQFHERSRQLARALLARGLRPGDRLAVLAENSCYRADVRFGPCRARVHAAQLPSHADRRRRGGRMPGP